MCLYHCTKLTLKEINTKFISLILYFTARSGPKKRKNGVKQTFFEKKTPKHLVGSQKLPTFAPAIRKTTTTIVNHHGCKGILGYGVMVTLQILVLSFLVRVRVPQQKSSSFPLDDFFVLKRKYTGLFLSFSQKSCYFALP